MRNSPPSTQTISSSASRAGCVVTCPIVSEHPPVARNVAPRQVKSPEGEGRQPAPTRSSAGRPELGGNRFIGPSGRESSQTSRRLPPRSPVGTDPAQIERRSRHPARDPLQELFDQHERRVGEASCSQDLVSERAVL